MCISMIRLKAYITFLFSTAEANMESVKMAIRTPIEKICSYQLPGHRAHVQDWGLSLNESFHHSVMHVGIVVMWLCLLLSELYS